MGKRNQFIALHSGFISRQCGDVDLKSNTSLQAILEEQVIDFILASQKYFLFQLRLTSTNTWKDSKQIKAAKEKRNE